MAKEKWDPPHAVRMPKKLWDELGEAAEANGTDRGKLLRDYARRYVAAWKGRQPKGDHGDSSDS